MIYINIEIQSNENIKRLFHTAYYCKNVVYYDDDNAIDIPISHLWKVKLVENLFFFVFVYLQFTIPNLFASEFRYSVAQITNSCLWRRRFCDSGFKI